MEIVIRDNGSGKTYEARVLGHYRRGTVETPLSEEFNYFQARGLDGRLLQTTSTYETARYYAQHGV